MASRARSLRTALVHTCLPFFFLLIQATNLRAHEQHPVPARMILSADTYEVLLDFDVPALMLSETLNHTDPEEAARQLRELRPEERERALSQAERFFRINLKVEIDGRRQKPEIELPSFEHGPLGRLGDAGSAFKVRIAGTLPRDARSLRLAPGRAIGIVELEAFDPAGVLLRRETVPGGMEGEPISIPRVTEPRKASPAYQAPGDLMRNQFLLGLRGLMSGGVAFLLFLAALLLLAPGWRPVLGQFSAFLTGCLLLLALAGRGHLHVPAGLAELLAGATAGVLALENLVVDRLRVWRPSMVFVFGAVHGVALALPFSTASSGLGATSSRPGLALLVYAAGAVGGLALLACVGWGLFRRIQEGRADSKQVNRRLSSLVVVIALLWTIRSMVSG